MAILGYIVNIVSFVGTVLLLPLIQKFIAPLSFLSSVQWAVIPITYILGWVLMVFVFPRVLVMIIGLFMNK